MKLFLTTILILAFNLCHAQVKLQEKDLNNLIAISELYSSDVNLRGDELLNKIKSFRTPILSHLVDGLEAVSKADKDILEPRFLSRPTNEELVLWYVIREIHYNQVGSNKKPNIDVANEVLSKNIDERWLLDNYYYRLHGGIAMLFNNKSLRKYDFNIENLGFKNETEKAIFFLNMMDALIGKRFQVLQAMKNNEKIIEFCNRLPKFNEKEYYQYKNFDYDDFQWNGYDKIESYNTRHIGGLYNTLIAQFMATAVVKNKKEAQEVYFNSILHEPKYFKYTPLANDLQTIYNQSK